MRRGWPLRWAVLGWAVGALVYLELASSSEYGGFAPVSASKALLYAGYLLAGASVGGLLRSAGSLLCTMIVPPLFYGVSFTLAALLAPLSVPDILMVWSLQRTVAGLLVAGPLVLIGALLGSLALPKLPGAA